MTGTKPVVKEPAKAIDEEPFMEPEQPNYVDPLGILLLQEKLIVHSDGPLLATLVALIPAAEGIESEKDLYHYLYDQADQQGYSTEEIDALLASEIGKNDIELLKQQMLEHADGALMEYLEQLDLETQGIRTSEELLKHLGEAAVAEGFRMEDVRKVMLECLGLVTLDKF